MYTSDRLRRASNLGLAILLWLTLTPAGCIAAEAVTFSPPGTLTDRGRFMQSDGSSLYRAICQGCHMPDGRGAQGAGAYPSLAGNPRLASAVYPAVVILQGRRGMPQFDDSLSDVQVAATVNYVRTAFGNNYADELMPADVTRLRAGPASAAAATATRETH